MSLKFKKERRREEKRCLKRHNNDIERDLKSLQDWDVLARNMFN